MTNNNSKNWLQILDVSANVLGTIGTLVIAGIGIWFTNSYNNSQQDLDRNEALTSVIEFIDESKPEAQLKTAYNILINLGYKKDFMALAVDYPNPIATQKLIDLLVNNTEDKPTPEDKETQKEARKSLEIILEKAKNLESQKSIITGETEKNLRNSVNIIAQQSIERDLSTKAEQILSQPTVKTDSGQKLEDLWVVIFGSYQSENFPTEEIKKLERTLQKDNLGIRVYERDGKYRLVSVYKDQATARNALKKAKEERPSSYLRNLGDWCEQKQCKEKVVTISTPQHDIRLECQQKRNNQCFFTVQGRVYNISTDKYLSLMLRVPGGDEWWHSGNSIRPSNNTWVISMISVDLDKLYDRVEAKVIVTSSSIPSGKPFTELPANDGESATNIWLLPD